MIIKRHPISSSSNEKITDIVSWEPRYATGILPIDKQHKELVDLTNKLFHACLSKKKDVDAVYNEALHKLVEYVRFHFSDEEKILQSIGFPEYPEHKKEHETLIKEILASAKNYNAGGKFVPNQCVRTLKDWIFGHIAVTDKVYSVYVKGQRKKGLLIDL